MARLPSRRRMPGLPATPDERSVGDVETRLGIIPDGRPERPKHNEMWTELEGDVLRIFVARVSGDRLEEYAVTLVKR